MNIAVFELGMSRYGLPLESVLEYLRIPAIVPLPKAPPIIEGVVNLRGKIVPVLDIRSRFRLPAKPPEPSDHLIVAQAGTRTVAVRVDRPQGIISLESGSIQDALEISSRAEYLLGAAKVADGIILIHDLATFLSASEEQEIEAALGEHGEGAL